MSYNFKNLDALMKDAGSGDVHAQYYLAQQYANGGSGIEQDSKKGVEWLQKAAEGGNAEAQCVMYELCADKESPKHDMKKALEWLHKSAENGFAQAQNTLAERYNEGIDIEQNLDKGLYWYTKAAENGVITAQFWLYLFYNMGGEVQYDPKKALEWLVKSAENGYAEAQYNLACCYVAGTNGLAQSDSKAAPWLEKAAIQGFETAYFPLANFYENGDGVKKDLRKAEEYYRKAAPVLLKQAETDGNAALALGGMYACGSGVAMNKPVGAYWYQKAVELGNEGARKYLDNMLNQGIRPAQSGKGLDDIKTAPNPLEKKQTMIALAAAGVLGVIGLIAGGFFGLIIGAAIGFAVLKYGGSVIKAFRKGYNS